MKDIVIDVLRRENLLYSNKKPRINILLSGTIGFEVFLGKRLVYFVKLSVCKERAGIFDMPYFDLQSEYLSQVKSYSIFPEFIPEPVGYYTVDMFNLFICKGVSHFPINSYEINRGGALFEKLKFYFEKAQNGLVTNGENQRAVFLLKKIVEDDGLAEHSDCLKKWLCGDNLKILEELHEMPKHGDFSINNIGLTNKKQLVIFDWEDMGKVYLPGFDLFTLIVSALNFDKIEVIKLLEGDNNYHSWSNFVEEVCELCFIDYGIFKQLFPVYLSVFIYLKKHYSIAVREKAIGLLGGVSCIS